MRILTLLAILALQSALGGTPSEAFDAFKKAAKAKDFETTWKLTAKFDGVPEQVTEQLKGKVRKFIDYASKGWDFEIIEEKVDGECAVVVIKEPKKEGNSEIDLDPAYLIQQNGEWHVFPDVSGWRLVEQAAKDKADTYKKLEAWFKERKTVLKKRPNG